MSYFYQCDCSDGERVRHPRGRPGGAGGGPCLCHAPATEGPHDVNCRNMVFLSSCSVLAGISLASMISWANQIAAYNVRERETASPRLSHVNVLTDREAEATPAFGLELEREVNKSTFVDKNVNIVELM